MHELNDNFLLLEITEVLYYRFFKAKNLKSKFLNNK